jgi:hypothetical protein
MAWWILCFKESFGPHLKPEMHQIFRSLPNVIDARSYKFDATFKCSGKSVLQDTRAMNKRFEFARASWWSSRIVNDWISLNSRIIGKNPKLWSSLLLWPALWLWTTSKRTVVHQIAGRDEIACPFKIWHPKDLAVTQNRNVNRTWLK